MWDRFFVPATAQAREHMMRLALLKPGERVLDIGTGTGESAVLAARRVGRNGRVLGIDVSTLMLKRARRKAVHLGLTNLKFRQMDSTSPRLRQGSFDVIITSFGTPEGPYDGAGVLRKWFRVLAPGGRLCICEGADDKEVSKTIERVFNKYKVAKPSPRLARKRQLQSLISKEKKRGQMAHFSNPRTLLRELRDAGFSDMKISTGRFPTFFPSSRMLLDLLIKSDFSDEFAAMPPEIQLEFRREFAKALRPYESSRGILWGDNVVFSQARKREPSSLLALGLQVRHC